MVRRGWRVHTPKRFPQDTPYDDRQSVKVALAAAQSTPMIEVSVAPDDHVGAAEIEPALRNRIVATTRPGVATRDAPDGQPTALQEAIFTDSLKAILGACRVVDATWR